MTTFPISGDTMVVTSTYVTKEKKPILCITREPDEEGGELWQFHCGNGDYSMEKMQLVRLDTILSIDPKVVMVSGLDLGACAKRSSPTAPWIVESAAQ
jgi:hypothetical protein